MYLGRWQLGDVLPVTIRTALISGAPTTPDNAPVLQIWNSSGTLVYSSRMPVQDRFALSATYFLTPLMLNSAFSTGRYDFVMSYALSGDVRVFTGCFEVLAGGDSSGMIESMAFFRKAHADFVVYQTADATLTHKRNPSV